MRNTKTAARPCVLNRNQEAIVREFIVSVEDESIPVKGSTLSNLYDLLGYRVAPNGARINKNREDKFRLGETYDPEDEFYSDWQEITDEEIAESNDTPESGAGESAKGSEVR